MIVLKFIFERNPVSLLLRHWIIWQKWWVTMETNTKTASKAPKVLVGAAASQFSLPCPFPASWSLCVWKGVGESWGSMGEAFKIALSWMSLKQPGRLIQKSTRDSGLIYTVVSFEEAGTRFGVKSLNSSFMSLLCDSGKHSCSLSSFHLLK